MILYDDARLIYKLSADGKRVFILDPFGRRCFDPVTLAIGAMAVGTGVQVAGSIQEGKMADKIGKQRAAVDAMKAKQTMDNARTEADIVGEKRNRLIAQNLSQFAASGIKINSPMANAATAETERVMNADISSILNRGRQGESDFTTSSAMEKAIGKSKKRQSVWDAVGTGVSGAGSMAWMGYDAGWGSGGLNNTGRATLAKY